MITGFHRPLLGVALGVLAVTSIACERAALLAPVGSTITLSALATTVPLSGTTKLIAQVIEPSGTPPQRGTVVTFATSLGTIEPVDAETDSSGRVTVTFNAGTQSGTATITAVSGGVATGATGAVKIAVGAAAVASIGLTAVPTPISPGGKSTISATVSDAGGSVVVGVPVTFSTDNGSLNPVVATTNASGTASTTLTTNKTAKVTATSGIPSTSGTTTTPAPTASITVTVDAAPTVSITSSTPNPTASTATTFTITAQPGSGSSATIQNVRVNFDDGEIRDLGAATGTITVSHVYTSSRTYSPSATATDTNGATTSTSTVIVVGSAPTASFTVSPASPPVNTQATFNGTASTSSSPITTYAWNFGDGFTQSGGSATVNHTYSSTGNKLVTLTITDGAGRTATASQTINVVP